MYLKKHEYGNATTEDLWAALTTVSGVGVIENMAAWINHVGYPVLTVTEKANAINIEQAQFLSMGNALGLISYSRGIVRRGHELLVGASRFEIRNRDSRSKAAFHCS